MKHFLFIAALLLSSISYAQIQDSITIISKKEGAFKEKPKSILYKGYTINTGDGLYSSNGNYLGVLASMTVYLQHNERVYYAYVMPKPDTGFYINLVSELNKGTVVMRTISTRAKRNSPYLASNGITYKVGDTIRLGKGSAPDGTFKFLTPDKWEDDTKPKTFDARQFDKASGFDAIDVVITKIYTNILQGITRVFFIVETPNGAHYYLSIEDAIAACEIKDCKPPVQHQLSPADEIAKFKKLLDDGAITQEEFNEQKKKLLAK